MRQLTHIKDCGNRKYKKFDPNQGNYKEDIIPINQKLIQIQKCK